jgi:hypothetical protein
VVEKVVDEVSFAELLLRGGKNHVFTVRKVMNITVLVPNQVKQHEESNRVCTS